MRVLNKVYKENFFDYEWAKKKFNQKDNYFYNNNLILQSVLAKNYINKKSKILEIGCGLALHSTMLPNYIGIDISANIIRLAKKVHKKKLKLIVCSATKIPIRNSYVDFIFSFATLEHVKRPDIVFKEIDRILKKNSILLLAPAWNCRKYIVQKLVQRSYKDLNIYLKISKFFIFLQNNFIYRAFLKLPLRIYDEFLYFRSKKIKFRYSRLYPSYNLWKKYPPIADDDAVISADAHSAILYFISRGYKCISHKNFLTRLFCKGDPILLKKI
jgi:ubiquinone/menaquinone biosynthesis C-methylase UbiE